MKKVVDIQWKRWYIITCPLLNGQKNVKKVVDKIKCLWYSIKVVAENDNNIRTLITKQWKPWKIQREQDDWYYQSYNSRANR